jgi:hypothetical protein
VIFAALYAKKVTSGGKRLRSMDRIPIVKSSTILVMVDWMQMSDVVVYEFQFLVALDEKDILLLFSNARRRALSKYQHRRAHTNDPTREG